MRTRRIATIAAGAALSCAAWAMPASAAAAQAEWAGWGTSSCQGAGCEVDAASTSCAEVTTVENVTISVSGCSATLTGTHSRFRAGSTYLCVGLGTGTLSYVDSNGLTYPPIGVTIAVDDGTLTYRGMLTWGFETFSVAGTISPGCAESATFTGTLSRV